MCSQPLHLHHPQSGSLQIKMAPTLPEADAASANIPVVANTGFRLGEEEQFSDASDSDQSQTSQRSASPRRANGQAPATKSKSKKQKDRRKMGALADELVDVLGDAFATPQTDSQTGMSRVGAMTIQRLFMLRALAFDTSYWRQ
jgi:hypothetical protein